MKFTVRYPLAQSGCVPSFVDPAAVTRFARAAEGAGFSAIAFTEHPSPSDKWLRAGGHDAFDPFVALSFCAAVTDRIALMTYLAVLPYRNPLLAAKSIATLDVLSAGRVILGVGSGYLRSEFAALCVDFAERNALLDESVETMRAAWSTTALHRRGRHFHAIAQTAAPLPVQPGGPPFWIGGNSRRARDRVVRYGNGWSPLVNDARSAATTRTSLLSSPSELACAVRELRDALESAGRDPTSVAIQVETAAPALPAPNAAIGAHVDLIGSYASAGAAWYVVDAPAGDVEVAIDTLNSYGDKVIRQLSGKVHS
jgi:probable F420-dependent oxidoreductase